jgi:hypothetical protein
MNLVERLMYLQQRYGVKRHLTLRLWLKRASCVAVAIVLSLAVNAAQAQTLDKTITVSPGVKTVALTSWRPVPGSCTAITAIPTPTIAIPPSHGVLSFAQSTGVVPFCPSGSPALPDLVTYYTWTGGTSATSDSFQVIYSAPASSNDIANVTVKLVGPPPDVFKVNYFSNNVTGAPDATLRIDNPGLTYGNLCALIYVFDADQQLSECCGCMETHNGLRTLSVHSDLTRNPLTGVVSANGVVKLVSSLPGSTGCDPTGNVAPAANLRAWVTHIGNAVGSTYPITETESSNSTLGATELSNLQAQCAFAQILGSGQGTCSCGTGD